MGMIHGTKSGTVEFFERYGRGKKNYAQMPAVLTAQADDGHIEAWRVDGSMRDAAEVVGRFFRLDGDAKRAAYPDVVAW